MKTPKMKHIMHAVALLLGDRNARCVTVFCGGAQRVTATRQFRVDGRNTRETLILTYGAYNHALRAYVKSRNRAELRPEQAGAFRIERWPTKVKARKK